MPEFGQPLVIEDRPIPEPGPGQITVRMEASGLCHTDIHAANGDWPVKPSPPFVPGHEGVGSVYAVGAGVTSPQPGQRVAVPWLGYACGTCKYCLTGWETLCLKQENSGYSVDGCYAEYFLAEAAFAALVPDGIDSVAAAPLTCAGVTTYKAIKVGNVRPADLVAISGCSTCSRCTPRAGPGSSARPGHWTRSTSPSRTCCTARPRHASFSCPDRDTRGAVQPVSDAAWSGTYVCMSRGTRT